MAQFSALFEVAVTWWPFELHPETPPEGRHVDEMVAPSRRTQEYREHLKAYAAEAGLTLASNRHVANSHRSLEVAEFARDRIEEPVDAGHLGMQELMLRLGRESGRARAFELPTRSASSAYSIDVCLRDDVQRVLFIEECWNTFGNINAAVRSTRRKIAEAEQLAVAIGGELGAYRVAAVWIVRDTRRNREILGRYPEVFSSAFTGPSRAWVRCLTARGVSVPAEMGLVWSDLGSTRLFAWRKS